ncbi:MAG: hypothetical protein ACOYM3_11375 [Terrimicrobiaceae bacterium]
MKLPTRPESRQSKINTKASATPKPQERETRPFAFGLTLKCRNLRYLRRLWSERLIDLVISDLTPLESITDADAETLMGSLQGVLKSDGAILLAANGVVGAALIEASRYYKYSIIFEVPSSHTADPSSGPVQNHVEYFVFYDKLGRFRPQKTADHALKVVKATTKAKTALSPDPTTGGVKHHTDYCSLNRNPRSVLRINGKNLKGNPSPVARIEYLLRSFSKRRDLLMDVMMTSPVARKACRNSLRNFVGFKCGTNLLGEMVRELNAPDVSPQDTLKT